MGTPARPPAAERTRPAWGDGAAARLVVLAAAARFLAGGPPQGHVFAAPGGVRVLESACPGQDCVHGGWVRRAGGRIICLPNRLVVSLRGSGGASEEFDAVTG